jgi:hypothetical protein
VDDHFLAQSGGHDIVAAGEGLEDALGYQTPQWLKENVFTHQGDTAANNDTARAKEGDDLANRFGQTGP